eukprot:COSAG01_NODE_3444_length_6087_cov_8.153140_8_plen_43_part_00
MWRAVVFAERTRGAHWFDSIRIMSKMRGGLAGAGTTHYALGA